MKVLRRKIEYLPNVRALNTHGGRDLAILEGEAQAMAARRPFRVIEEYGPVDIEWLTMQLRSGVRVEVTNALAVLYHLSWLRAGQGSATGLPMNMCEDLTEVLLDLLEETAFGSIEDAEEPDDAGLSVKVVTNKHLARIIHEREQGLFAGLDYDKEKPFTAPVTPPWEIVYIIVSMLANLASVPENPPYFASIPRILDIVLRVCMLEPLEKPTDTPRPASKALQLHHLLRVRREALSLVALMGDAFDLSNNPPRTSRRLFSLIAATLMDPELCHSPTTQILQQRQPSPAMDLALDAFSRVSHPDGNRTCLGRNVSPDALWSMTQMLSRLLPLTDADITSIQNEQWLSFILKVALCIYSLVVLAPTPIRRKMKSSPSFRSSLTRFLRACTRDREMNVTQAGSLFRNMVPIARDNIEQYWRRIVEILRVIDEEEDPLATFSSGGGGGMVGFGIGGSYGEHNSKPPPRGTGILGGTRSDFLWGAMWQAATADPLLFEDWENLVRVDSATAAHSMRG